MSVVERERVEEVVAPGLNEREADEVALAAIWMDVEYPGWASRIDVEELDLYSCPACIIGQAAGEDDWFRLYAERRLTEYLRGGNPTGVSPFSHNDSKPYWLNEIAKRV